jgi:hypothetical protein
MTRIFSSCIFLFFAFLLLGLTACHKDKSTTINGTVADKHTGEPVDSALVTIKITHKDGQAPNNIEYSNVLTDESGNFFFSHTSTIRIYEVQKNGHLLRGQGSDFPKLSIGAINDIKIDIIPKDGTLKLLLEAISKLNFLHKPK